MTHDGAMGGVPAGVVHLDFGRRSLVDCRLDVEKVLDAPEEPLSWRCDRLAADGCVTVLTGAGGEGKSFLALGLAKAVAEGASVAGISCALGRVVIFDAENGARLLARRVKATRIPRDGVAVYEADGFDIRRDMAEFVEVIQCERANLVVLDSLRILAPGAKESEADDMAPVMTAIRRLARETGAAIIVVHHRGKGEGASDYRGSSVIRDQADMMFVLERNATDPQATTRRSVRTSKCRIDAEPETRWLTLHTDPATGEISIRKADPFGGRNGSAPPGPVVLAEELRQHLQREPQSRAALARAVGRSEGDGQVKRALDFLAAEGFTEQTSKGWRLIDQPSDLEDSALAAEIEEF